MEKETLLATLEAGGGGQREYLRLCVCVASLGSISGPGLSSSCAWLSAWFSFIKSFDCFSRFNSLPSRLMTAEHAMKYELIGQGYRMALARWLTRWLQPIEGL